MAALVSVDRIRPLPDHCPASAFPRIQPVAVGGDLFCAAGVHVSLGRRHRAPSRQQAESGLNTSLGGEISDVQEVANTSCRKALSIGAGGGNRTRIYSLGSCKRALISLVIFIFRHAFGTRSMRFYVSPCAIPACARSILSLRAPRQRGSRTSEADSNLKAATASRLFSFKSTGTPVTSADMLRVTFSPMRRYSTGRTDGSRVWRSRVLGRSRYTGFL